MYRDDVIEVWNLTPGGPAHRESQAIFNVVGRVANPEQVEQFSYRLNGGAETPVVFRRSADYDDGRLFRQGDFNIDTIRSSELRAENRMTLELRIDGEGPFEFDSGLVPVAAAFPNIEISIDAAPVCREITVSVVAGESPLNCYADCDRSTGAGVLDIFDFLCFQNAFVSQREYACDCDTSSGHGVCDLFDFLCFQGAFVGGCP